MREESKGGDLFRCLCGRAESESSATGIRA